MHAGGRQNDPRVSFTFRKVKLLTSSNSKGSVALWDVGPSLTLLGRKD